ncbi:MAG: helix-turn-helix domain-containing protein [Actinomadura sp.]
MFAAPAVERLRLTRTAMITLINTDAVPPAERIDFVRSRHALAPRDYQPADEADFSFELRYVDLGAVFTALITATPYEVRRTPALIRPSDPDLISLTMTLEGHGSVSQYDRDAELAPGEFAIQFVGNPYRINTGKVGKGLQLSFSPALLPLTRRQLHQLAAVPMRRAPGIGALTSKFLVELARDLDDLTPVEAARISTVALDMIAVRLAHELDSTGSLPPESRKNALLTGVYAFIQQHLGNAELSPAVVAAAHHISTRYLHTLFQDQETTVAGWIRRCRLEAARRDLTDPMLVSRSVASIAAQWGFSGASQFTQAFKAAYGMPPRDYRQQAFMSDHSRLRADRVG